VVVVLQPIGSGATTILKKYFHNHYCNQTKPKKQPEKRLAHTKQTNNNQKENSRKTLVNDEVIETEIMVISRVLHQKGLRYIVYGAACSLGNLRIEQKVVRDNYSVYGTIADYDRQPYPHLFCSYQPSRDGSGYLGCPDDLKDELGRNQQHCVCSPEF
jgi:hypothetical protein